MNEIEVLIDPSSAVHAELVAGLRKSLNALETVKFREQKKPVPPGTLSPGLDHVVAYVIHHQDKLLGVTTALLNVISNLLRFRSTKATEAEKKNKPAVIIVRDEKLALPSSESAKKRFLKRVESMNSSQTSEKKRAKASVRRQRGATGRKKK